MKRSELVTDWKAFKIKEIRPNQMNLFSLFILRNHQN